MEGWRKDWIMPNLFPTGLKHHIGKSEKYGFKLPLGEGRGGGRPEPMSHFLGEGVTPKLFKLKHGRAFSLLSSWLMHVQCT